MAPQVTEFASLTLKPGADLSKGSADAAVLNESFATLRQQPGCQRIYWGTKVEDRDSLQMIIDWETHDAHITFTKSEAYGPFVKAIGAILGGPPSLHHVAFKPHPPTAGLSERNAGATEILSLYFPASLSSADRDALSSNFDTFSNALLKAGNNGLKGFNTGWLVEDDVPYEKAEGGKATLFRAVLGWESVEAHMACRETTEFKDNIHVVRQAPGLLGLDVFHINPTDA